MNEYAGGMARIWHTGKRLPCFESHFPVSLTQHMGSARFKHLNLGFPPAMISMLLWYPKHRTTNLDGSWVLLRSKPARFCCR